MINKISTIILLTILLITAVLPQFQYASVRYYWPGLWDVKKSWGEYKLGYWHKDTFHVNWGVAYKYPAVGYPYRSGNTVGVNDTVKVEVVFLNETDEDYYIGSSTPEDWFYPVLYDPYVDVFTTPMLVDTSNFEYRFENWMRPVNGLITTKPDTIFCPESRNLGRRTTHGIIYSMWGLPPGTFRVILKATTSKPADIKLVVDDSQNTFTMSTGQDMLDTLNSYCTIAISALSRREMTLFNTHVGNIFTLNPKSVPGWALRYHGYNALADTTNAIMAIDSLLYNIVNRLDPQIPDSSKMTPVHGTWLTQWVEDYGHYRARMLNPDGWKYGR